jgi:hypothetical protein
MAKTVFNPGSIPKTKVANIDHKPEVILDFIFDRGMFFISIENIGDKPALKVTTKFNRRIMGVGGKQKISSLPLFQNIEFLAPHKSIVTFLDTSNEYFRRGEPTKITARISYCDSDGRQYQTIIHHDLGIYEGIGYLRYPLSEGNSSITYRS